ncbi:MAG: methionine synthase [Phycisphaerales bacterium]|nr:methionine synthase [Phycisphaerales bacterium]
MSTPTIRTTVVGSYPVPDWLAALPSQQSLIDATRVVFKTQEMAGIDVVADGELYRFDVNHPDTNGMIEYFIRPMTNIRSAVTRADIEEFSKLEGMGFRSEPAGVVEGPIEEGTLNLPRDYRRARALTNHPMKFTLTGPHMLCKTLMDHHYKDRAELALALGKALAKQVADLNPQVLQIDEANIPGHPDEGPWAAEAINLILDAVATKIGSGAMSSPIEKAVHLCFGNYGGQSIQKGEWRKLIDFMNRLHCDHVVLEFAFRGYAELVHFKELKPEIAIGLGVIDVKVNTVETPDLVARRIAEATKILGPDRIKWVHPDCGFWMNKRSIADRKMEALVKGRDLFLGSR